MIISTRSILSALALPTNLIAGSSEYPFSNYLIFDSVGELIWISGYGTLGYLSGTEWETISGFVAKASWLLATILIIAISIYLLLKSSNKKDGTGQAQYGKINLS